MSRHFTVRALFALSALFIVYATTVPFDFAHAPTFANANLIPFWDAERGRIHSIPDIAQNIALFVPLGFFAVLAIPALQRGSAIASAIKAALIGLALSMFVEALQTMSEFRRTSATDLATNFLGAGAGGLAARIYGGWVEARLRRALVATLSTQPGLLIVIAFLIATILLILAPFIPTLDVGMLRAKGRLLLDNPMGTKPLGSLPIDALFFGALAFAATIELPLLAARKRWIKTAPTASLGAVIVGPIVAAWAVALECAQLPLVHHNPGIREAIANVTGALAGAMLAASVARGTLRPSPQLGAWTARWPALVFAFTAAVPVLRALAPFKLRSWDETIATIDWERFLPFWLFFNRISFATITNVFEAALMYLPLGWALGARGRSPVFAWVVGLLLAESLEVAQIAIEGRYFDITEGLLASTGAAFGVWLFRRLRALR